MTTLEDRPLNATVSGDIATCPLLSRSPFTLAVASSTNCSQAPQGLTEGPTECEDHRVHETWSPPWQGLTSDGADDIYQPGPGSMKPLTTYWVHRHAFLTSRLRAALLPHPIHLLVSGENLEQEESSRAPGASAWPLYLHSRSPLIYSSSTAKVSI